MTAKVPAREQPKFILRFPNEQLRDRLAEAAKASGQSMNAEIIARLEASLEDEELEKRELVSLNRMADMTEDLVSRLERYVETRLAKQNETLTEKILTYIANMPPDALRELWRDAAIETEKKPKR